MATTINYPAALPAPTRAAYGFQHISPFQRTDMSTGKARQRRTFQAVPSIGSFELHLTNPEAQVFEAWFAHEITDGADWFNIDLKTPIGHMASYECRFVEMYDGPVLSALSDWKFTLQLELVERPVLSEEWNDFGQQFILDQSIIDLAANVEWPML